MRRIRASPSQYSPVADRSIGPLLKHGKGGNRRISATQLSIFGLASVSEAAGDADYPVVVRMDYVSRAPPPLKCVDDVGRETRLRIRHSMDVRRSGVRHYLSVAGGKTTGHENKWTKWLIHEAGHSEVGWPWKVKHNDYAFDCVGNGGDS